MFELPRYVQNSFSVLFPPIPDIRRRANQFEDRLTGEYAQPEILPIPDDIDPAMPRIIFGSKRGLSQIVIAPISIAFNVTYTPNYQIDAGERQKYLQDRIPTVFKLVDVLKNVRPYFCGLTTQVNLPSNASEQDILKRIAELFLKETATEDKHDIQIKFTNVVQDRFFSNIVVENYRNWPLESISQATSAIPSLSREHATERGIRITADFNDRYAFNEKKDYHTSRDVYRTILDIGLSAVSDVIKQIEGGIS